MESDRRMRGPLARLREWALRRRLTRRRVRVLELEAPPRPRRPFELVTVPRRSGEVQARGRMPAP
jgi:hypothetical protein